MTKFDQEKKYLKMVAQMKIKTENIEKEDVSVNPSLLIPAFPACYP